MKKLFATMMALALALSMSVNAFAASGSAALTEAGGSQDIDVTAKYVDSTAEETVYSVDIAWEDMTFTYTEAGAKVWNPADHTYTDNTSSGWDKTQATITVTNHSNAAVTANFAYSEIAGTGVTGELDTVSKTLAAGVENAYASAESVTSTLTISGTPNSSVTEAGVKVGTVTVTLS